jgi:ketosteroid isomerase-like protein
MPAIALLLAVGCSEPAPPPAPAAPPPPPVKTAQERVQLFQDCWNHFNTKAYDRMATCYASSINVETADSAMPKITTPADAIAQMKKEEAGFPDRRGELRYVFLNGGHIASIVLYTGTNSGPMTGPDGKPMPATNKSVGMLVGQVLDLDANGAAATRETVYFEEGTMMAQLGLSPNPARKAEKATGAAPIIVMAKNDATEAANVTAVRAMYDAFTKKDVKAMQASMADDYKLIEVAQAMDMDKKAADKSMSEFMKGFPDVTPTITNIWAAGDFVIVEGSISGTNTGPMPSMGMKKATGKKITVRFLEVYEMSGGKAKTDWLFYNGAAFATQLGLM